MRTLTTRTIRTYSELSTRRDFLDRFRYLSLHGSVGRSTFGFDRYLNQKFYTSREWKNIRYEVINRDSGCDLGVPGFEIHSKILIHHINPITVDEIIHSSDVLDPQYLITTTHRTHNAIHFGDESLLPKKFVERQPGDTRLW